MTTLRLSPAAAERLGLSQKGDEEASQGASSAKGRARAASVWCHKASRYRGCLRCMGTWCDSCLETHECEEKKA